MSDPAAPYSASPTPPEKKGVGWGKIVLLGCLGLFVLGVVLAGAGYVGYRYYEERQTTTISGTADEDATPGVVGNARQVHEGTLGAGDETQQDGSWYDAWPTQLTDGMRVVFRLESDDFDTYLTVVSPGGETTSDDDSGGGTNSRVELTAHESGTWNVLANSLRAGDTGSYRLTIETSR